MPIVAVLRDYSVSPTAEIRLPGDTEADLQNIQVVSGEVLQRYSEKYLDLQRREQRRIYDDWLAHMQVVVPRRIGWSSNPLTIQWLEEKSM